MYAGTDRRRRDVSGRLARATWPARRTFRGIVENFPCNVIGHRWVEIPRALRRTNRNDGRRMRFKCSRCGLVAGT